MPFPFASLNFRTQTSPKQGVGVTVGVGVHMTPAHPPLGVEEAVGVGVGVGRSVGVLVMVADGVVVRVGVRVGDAVTVGVTDGVRVELGVGVRVAVLLGVGVAVNEAVGVRVGVGVMMLTHPFSNPLRSTPVAVPPPPLNGLLVTSTRKQFMAFGPGSVNVIEVGVVNPPVVAPIWVPLRKTLALLSASRSKDSGP